MLSSLSKIIKNTLGKDILALRLPHDPTALPATAGSRPPLLHTQQPPDSLPLGPTPRRLHRKTTADGDSSPPPSRTPSPWRGSLTTKWLQLDPAQPASLLPP